MSTVANPNVLRSDVDYIVQETTNGVWRRYLYSDGRRFAEFKSYLNVGGLPLVHYTYGICPQTGRRITAHGIIAIGRIASGVVAIGQFAIGLVAIGQLSIGLLLALGQASFGAYCLGQLAFGTNVLAQMGFGKHVVDMHGVDPAAKDFFLGLIGK